MTYATRITATRKARGMTMSALADLCGVSPTAVSNWESGNTYPRDESLASLARSLGVTVEYLENGSPNNTEALDVKTILDRAKEQLAAATGMPIDQVRLRFAIEA